MSFRQPSSIASGILCILALTLFATAADAARRVALVIGNSNYINAPALANPANDAADMSAKLRSLGFEVVEGRDLDMDGMRRAVRQFVQQLTGAQVALFFYAGHGLQVDGRNYMAPIEARLESRDDLNFETMPIDFVLTSMERKTKTNIVFLDACRNNPLAQNLSRSMGTRGAASVGRGLARMGVGVGTLISYATQPGNVALDGSGRNSPFTGALVQRLGAPGEDISKTLRKVRNDVLSQTGGKQVPWENSSLTGEVVFNTLKAIQSGVEEVGTQIEASRDSDYEITYWNSIRDSNDPAFFDAYLREFPNGRFASLARLKMDTLGGAASAPAPAPQRPQKAPAQVASLPPQTAPAAPAGGGYRVGQVIERTEILRGGLSRIVMKVTIESNNEAVVAFRFEHDDLARPITEKCRMKIGERSNCRYESAPDGILKVSGELPRLSFDFNTRFASSYRTVELW